MMIPVLDNWNIVLVGAWNTRIFNVVWLGEFIFPEIPTVNAAVSLVPSHLTKFMAEGIEIIPTEERLLLRPTDISDKTLELLENKAREILRLLSHTPVTAVGVNMTYRTDSPDADLLKVFALNDDAKLVENKLMRSSCSVSRAFTNNVGMINLILTEAQGAVDLQFNFHYDVKNTEQVSSYLDARLVACKQQSLEIAHAIYGLEPGEE